MHMNCMLRVMIVLLLCEYYTDIYDFPFLLFYFNFLPILEAFLFKDKSFHSSYKRIYRQSS